METSDGKIPGELHWVVPNRAQRASSPPLLLLGIVVVFYIAIFTILIAVGGILRMFAPGKSTNEPILDMAFLVANACGGMMAVITVLLYVVCPKEHITLGRDGVFMKLGNYSQAFPYSAMTDTRIEPNRRVPSLYWLSFATPSGARREFSMPLDLDPQLVINFLNSRGVPAGLSHSPSPRAPRGKELKQVLLDGLDFAARSRY